MSEVEQIEFLKQQRFIGGFLASQGTWTTLYKSYRDEHVNVLLYSALSPTARRDFVVADTSWDLTVGHGKPCFNQISHGGEELAAEYMRFGNNDGVEPLVVKQNTPVYGQMNFVSVKNLSCSITSTKIVPAVSSTTSTTMAPRSWWRPLRTLK